MRFEQKYLCHNDVDCTVIHGQNAPVSFYELCYEVLFVALAIVP